MNTVRSTTCNRDCPDACTLLVEVNDQGRAVRLRGSSDDPITQGFLCERTSRFLGRQYCPSRITQPRLRRRKEDSLQEVSWEEALDWAAQSLLRVRQESGPGAILHYRSGGSLGLLKQLSDLLFENFGPVALKRGDICSGAGEAAQEADFGVCDSHSVFDLRHSRNIILWGKNVHTSSPHLLPLLLERQKAGTRLLAIDPVRTRLASLVDHFIQPLPGQDFALAMAVAQRLLQADLPQDPQQFCLGFSEFVAMVQSSSTWAQQAGVTPAEVELLAQALRERPCNIQIGWGMARRRSGGATVRAVDALAAISGNLGLAGGGASYYYRRRGAFDSLGLRGLEGAPRSFSEARLGQEILEADPPLRLAWITAGNPVAMLPDSLRVQRALAGLETLIVVDTHPTDTTDLADLILPTLTLLEDDDLLGAFGNHYLRVSRPALTPPDGPRHELWIWQQLAQRLGLGPLLQGSPREWKLRLTGRLRQAGVELEQLERSPVANPFVTPVLFGDGRFPTPSGKVELITQAPPSPQEDPDFPLQLSAFSSPKSQASQWSVAPPPQPVARIHPQSSQGWQAGELVYLETPSGRLLVQLQLDPDVHPRQVLLSKGGSLRQGGSPNQLIVGRETDLGGGADYYDQPARLVRTS